MTNRERMETLRKDMMKEPPGRWQEVERLDASYTVRSQALKDRNGRGGEVPMVERSQAYKEAWRASQLPPERSAQVMKYDHQTMTERLEQAFRNGHRVAPEKGRVLEMERSR